MLYFAYGSNLHHLQMKRRCKDSIFLKKINLKDFRLTFRNMYADIEPKKNSIVHGAYLKFQKLMRKNWMCMKIIQLFIKNIILLIMEKK